MFVKILNNSLTNTIIFFTILLHPKIYYPQNNFQINKTNVKEAVVNTFYAYESAINKEDLYKTLLFIKSKEITFKEDSLNSKVLFLEAEKARLEGRLDYSIKLLDSALVIAKKNKDLYLEASIYLSYGVIYDEDEELEKSLQSYILAREIFKKENHKVPLIDLNLNLFLIYRDKEKWEKSLVHAKESVKLINELNVKHSRLKYLYNYIAHSELKLKNYKEVERYLQLAKDKTLKNFYFSRYKINITYGDLYIETNRLELAKEKYHEALSDLKKNNKYQKDKLKEVLTKDIELENSLKENKVKVINSQKKLLFVSILALITSLLISLWLYKLNVKIKLKNKKINELYKLSDQLNLDLKKSNKTLKEKTLHVQELLDFNKRILFSKSLKISVYNDSITSISKDISSLIKQNKDLSSNQLFSIEKNLMSLISEVDIWKDFKVQFENTRPSFFKELKKKANNLSTNDLKHCAYVVSNLKSKDVASLINVSYRSVETARYRIKKKLKLKKEDDLYSFLQTI